MRTNHRGASRVHLPAIRQRFQVDLGRLLPVAQNLPSLTLRRPPSGWRGLDGFWQFVPLARLLRITLLIVVPLGVVIDGALRLAGEPAGGFIEFAFSTATSGCLLLMLWRPPVAAVFLASAGFVAVAINEGGGYLTAVTASVGLVVYCCARSFAVAYGSIVVGWIVVFVAIPPGLPRGGVVTLFVIGLMSAAVGFSLQAMVRRNGALREALDLHDERLDDELRAERSRIADELHDIIAHDITIVAMHARVLQHTSDPEVRSVSQQAISRAAGQALADTRRVLNLIHGQQSDPTPAVTGAPGIRSILPQLGDQLRALGDTVTVSMAHGPELAKSIDATLVRMARESVTNIVKHGATPRTVHFALEFSRDSVDLRIENVPYRADSATHGQPGYGLARLHERADLLGGSFAAGQDGESWIARMTLPQR